MAKTSMVNREIKRTKIVKKFAARRAELKKIVLSSTAGYEEKMAAQEKLIAMGAKPLLKLARLHATLPFLSPGILDATAIKDTLPDQEYFGPLTQIIRVNTLDEAIAGANNTQFGLSSAIFTDRQEYFDTFLMQMRAGLVNWNRPTTGNSGVLPFGGCGVSGNHHPSGYYAADYCAYPVSSNVIDSLTVPAQVTPGIAV